MNTGVTGSISVMYPHQPTLVDPLESQLPSCSHVSPDVNDVPAPVPQWDTSVENGCKSPGLSMQTSESWSFPTVCSPGVCVNSLHPPLLYSASSVFSAPPPPHFLSVSPLCFLVSEAMGAICSWIISIWKVVGMPSLL